MENGRLTFAVAVGGFVLAIAATLVLRTQFDEALTFAPIVVAAVIWTGLLARRKTGSRVGFAVAAGAAGLSTAFSGVAAASIGLLLWPAAALLSVAVATTPRPH